MRKIAIGILSVIATVICIFTAACMASNAPVVGTYKLVTVTMSNGGDIKTYTPESELVSENSFVLEVKSDYKWKMKINLPGVDETEDGKWKDNNGSYTLEEDKDEIIHLTFKDNTLNFQMSEDGWLMNVTLKKV